MLRDDGQLTVLVLLYAAVAAAMVIVAFDVSTVLLGRRNLSAVADGAALAAADAVDRGALYRAGLGAAPPLSQARADQAVRRYLVASGVWPAQRSLRERTSVAAGEVTVELTTVVHVPFVRVLAAFAPRYADGSVAVAAVAHAVSGGG